MTFQKCLTDGTGAEIIVLVTIDEAQIGKVTAVRLARKARRSKSRKASACDGAITVTIQSDGPPR